ncbi:hypothetical protein [Methylobacterium thuringiense]|uniref:Uncharacterized protein n=1 Tax=Methylobacterium thuringiense TaxID=1003091 RepID=A0ABQ4TH40_9HYPH|nr:hypothetical protein [Methylobacterium thuringiense]GJE54538.1 hypothetical protein EKPJFOCH_1016 [Methylobacterium thuringiense]
MNSPALALASFVFVGLSVGAIAAIPLIVLELDRREQRARRGRAAGHEVP